MWPVFYFGACKCVEDIFLKQLLNLIGAVYTRIIIRKYGEIILPTLVLVKVTLVHAKEGSLFRRKYIKGQSQKQFFLLVLGQM